MAGASGRILSELGYFFEPVLLSLESGSNLAVLLSKFGIGLNGPALDTALNNLAPFHAGLVQLVDLSMELAEDGIQSADLDTVRTAAEPVIEIAKTFGTPFANVDTSIFTTQTLSDLPGEFLGYLLTRYLRTRLPLLLELFTLADVYRPEHIPEDGHAKSRGMAYTIEHYDWSRLRQLLYQPDLWAQEAYGWGTQDFQSDKALARLTAITRLLGGTPQPDHMTQAQLDAFMPHRVDDPVPPMAIEAPIWSHVGMDEDGLIDASRVVVGLLLMPVANAQGGDQGLALGPYAEGTLSGTHDLSAGLTLRTQGDFGASGGALFKFQPSGLTVATGIEASALNASFGIELEMKSLDETGSEHPIILAGQREGTRVEIASSTVKLGGAVTNSELDFYLAGGVKSFKCVIDPASDGLLSSILSNPLVIDAGDIVMGYRYSSGIYFEGGTSLDVTIPLDLSLGPVSIHQMRFEMDWADEPTLKAMMTADLKAGPLFAYAENIGVSMAVVEQDGGVFGGTHDLDFGFVPPTAYAISLDADPIKGGGLIDRRENEYRGALALQFSTIGFSAFGILNTELPDGEDGFSFAASIFAEFSVPLGFGFFLTGLGGMIGLNRTLDTDAMRNTLYQGNLDHLLFPDDPIENAASILDTMAAIMPAAQGQHIFGPVAKISWGKPSLIDVKLGLVIEIGETERIVILGGLSSELPTKDQVLIALKFSFFGEINFDQRTISFDGTLEGSRVLSFTISGDVAVRTGWATRLEHVTSFGGLHPLFPKPANLPDLRRLSISFGSNNPKLSLSAYVAVTNNSLQFGARADAYFKGPKIWLLGRVAAEGWVYFDALIYFSPFAFDVQLGGGLRILVDGKSKAELGFSLRLRGPNTFRFNGKVWITICGIDVDFGVDKTWGSERSIPAPSVDAVAVLREALTANADLAAIAPKTRANGIAYRSDETEMLDPFGGIRLTQNAVPLGVDIEKIGEGIVPSSANRLDIVLRRTNGQLIDTDPVNADFVRGHFFNLNEAQRLGATAFETHRAGFELDAETLVSDDSQAVRADYAYEYLPIDVIPDPAPREDGFIHAPIAPDFASRFLAPNSEELLERLADVPPEISPDDPIFIRDTGFVGITPDVGGRSAVTAGGFDINEAHASFATQPARVSLSEVTRIEERAVQSEQLQRAPNGVVADYIAFAATR